MILHRKTAPKINKDKDKYFFPQQYISEGGKNSEGGQNKVRNRTIFPRQETKKIIKAKNNHLPVGSVTQQISARDTRQQNRRLTKQVQQQINKKRLKQGYQMEPIRVKTKLTTRQSPEKNQRELHINEETDQPEITQWRSENPSFRTPRIISQEALMDFSLSAVGIERRFPMVEDSLT